MSGTRILVVDDSEITRALLVRHLRQREWRVLEAEDGAQGAVLALQELPDAVVTDLEMPVMDGFQLSRLLKADPATQHIPVVILTSHTEASSRFWGFDSGADAYVTKDELGDRLTTVLDHLLSLPVAARQSQESAAVGPLDVLARVARHLDHGLMEATLVNQVLQIGVDKGGFSAAARNVLQLVDRFTDSDLFLIAVAEERGLRIFVQQPEGTHRRVDLGELVMGAKRWLGAPEATVEVLQVIGALADAGERIDTDSGVRVTFGLRKAQGCLALWPRRPEAFAGLPRQLLEKVIPHVALVLDNVRLAEHLWELSTHDELTGVMNHRAIIGRLREELTRSSRYAAPCSLILSDIDHFKKVNDTYGHPAGDIVLREVARRLHALLRGSDVIGRYGGEEFLILLPNCELERAKQAAERLCRSLVRDPVSLLEQEVAIRVTASFGVACASEVEIRDGERALLSLADGRLYAAKAAGRACVKP